MKSINLSSFLENIFEKDINLDIPDIAEKSILRNKNIFQRIFRRVLVDYFSIFSNESFGDLKVFDILVPENYKSKGILFLRPGEKIEIVLLPIIRGINTSECFDFLKNISSDLLGEEGLKLIELIPKKEIPKGKILSFPSKIEEMEKDKYDDHHIPVFISKLDYIKKSWSWISYEGVYLEGSTPIHFLAVFFRRYRRS